MNDGAFSCLRPLLMVDDLESDPAPFTYSASRLVKGGLISLNNFAKILNYPGYVFVGGFNSTERR